jgi:hypothetical protein
MTVLFVFRENVFAFVLPVSPFTFDGINFTGERSSERKTCPFNPDFDTQLYGRVEVFNTTEGQHLRIYSDQIVNNCSGVYATVTTTNVDLRNIEDMQVYGTFTIYSHCNDDGGSEANYYISITDGTNSVPLYQVSYNSPPCAYSGSTQTETLYDMHVWKDQINENQLYIQWVGRSPITINTSSLSRQNPWNIKIYGFAKSYLSGSANGCAGMAYFNFEIAKFNITLTSVPPCDVNGDGVCTPLDALCTTQKASGICPTLCGPCENINCDVTRDQNCTDADADCRFMQYMGIHPNCFE